MPNTMIERIAQTIYFADHPGGPEPVALTEREIIMAHDILAAIREPTDHMTICGRAVLPEHDEPLLEDASNCWSEMIDAALSEEGQ